MLLIGRGNRPDLYNLRAHSPVSFVPRHLCFEVEERIEASGCVRTPLSLTSLEAAAAAIADARVEALAIMFLHSYANPEHEEIAASPCASGCPASPLWPVMTSRGDGGNTSANDDGPHRLRATRHGALPRNLAIAMRGRAYPKARSTLCSRTPASPTSTGLGETRLRWWIRTGRRRCGRGPPCAPDRDRDRFHLDVGGTTAKCSLVLNAQPQLRSEYRIEWTRANPGYPIQTPVVDIVEIGAGGGSIVRLGPGGAILVGPESAGASPGPACYGLGGKAPTITDAKLLTGALDPSRFSQGLNIDKAAAA